ncbi:serine hydrolase [Streptomyces sp. DW26H14]|uniref:serine hydrolase n=1 Tax=Streptomyces sp. DW26H14 TaxID=3435395 RepID=UPI00403D5C94
MQYPAFRRSVHALLGTTAVLALAGGTVGCSSQAASTAKASSSPSQSPKTTTKAASASASSPSLSSALRADLTGYLKAEGKKDHLSAMSVRVTYPNGRPSTAASAGTTTYGGHTPVSDDALWQIGSNTKAFTSVVLLKLEAEGKLSIDDTLGTWLPQYPAWRDITIKQLLTMSSGIPDYAAQPAFTKALQADPNTVATPQSLVQYVQHLPVGSHTYSYSNTNYVLAQMIIEKATHDSYFSQVTKRILKPLGMDHTCFGPETCPSSTASHMPTGYSMQAGLPKLHGKSVPSLNVSWAQGAGGLISSLADMATWDRALYTGHELPATQQRELESLISTTTGKPITATSAGTPEGYGLGVTQQFEPPIGRVWMYAGGTYGFRVLHVYVPSSGMLIALSANSEVDDNDSALKLFSTIYQTISTFKQN